MYMEKLVSTEKSIVLPRIESSCRNKLLEENLLHQIH